MEPDRPLDGTDQPAQSPMRAAAGALVPDLAALRIEMLTELRTGMGQATDGFADLVHELRELLLDRMEEQHSVVRARLAEVAAQSQAGTEATRRTQERLAALATSSGEVQRTVQSLRESWDARVVQEAARTALTTDAVVTEVRRVDAALLALAEATLELVEGQRRLGEAVDRQNVGSVATGAAGLDGGSVLDAGHAADPEPAGLPGAERSDVEVGSGQARPSRTFGTDEAAQGPAAESNELSTEESTEEAVEGVDGTQSDSRPDSVTATTSGVPSRSASPWGRRGDAAARRGPNWRRP